jgi:AcrR family transcriptional regulator
MDAAPLDAVPRDAVPRDAASPGLRERKTVATRQALCDAALRLAVENGPERVTVEEIADAANVSRRTFSNYFGSKDEALLHADRMRMRELVGLVRARPASEPPWTALRRGALELHQRIGGPDPEWIARSRLLRTHPVLLGRLVAAHAEWERELAAEIARRLPPADDAPLRAQLMAATFLATLRIAVRSWLDDPSRGPLAEVVERSLRIAGERFR